MTTSHDVSVMCHCITKMMQQHVPIGDSMSSGAPPQWDTQTKGFPSIEHFIYHITSQ